MGPEYDVAIVGAGCIGLSTAKHLAEGHDLDVCVVEKEYHLAKGQSVRNSGVLHPGFNYEPASLKAAFSREGTRRMKRYCREKGVPLYECGVLVVAADEEEAERLERMRDRAEKNSVEAEVLGREELREREPHSRGESALYCPEAASVDPQKYVYALAGDADNAGADFFLGHRVSGATRSGDGVTVETDKGELRARFLVNAAGVYADRVAHEMGVGGSYRIVPFRGEYYELVPSKSSLVNSMIYPVPDPELPFLGVHYTRRTDGKVIVGPNAVLALGREAYRNTEFDLGDVLDTASFPGFWRLVSARKILKAGLQEANKSYRKKAFVRDAKKLLRGVEGGDLVRSYAGIRAQLVSRQGELVEDLHVSEGERSLHVLNAVSPGLTGSLPFGERLSRSVLEKL